MAYRWYVLIAMPIDHWAGFDATIGQCEAAFHPAALTTTNRTLVSPQTRCYVKGGWTVLIGFDERGHAEQFVVSKSSLITPTPDLGESEQTKLLEEFGQGIRWIFEGNNNGIGPLWEREDGQAHASYISSAHYMVLMNKAGMDRQIRALNEEAAAARRH